MSDWEFLYEMHARGCSAEEIADPAAVGYAPWDKVYISRQWVDEELKGQSPDLAESLKSKEPFKSRDGFPFSVLKQAEILEDLVDCAARHFRNTGRYLQVWGELGEIYAEVKFGLRGQASPNSCRYRAICSHGWDTRRSGISRVDGTLPSDRLASRCMWAS